MPQLYPTFEVPKLEKKTNQVTNRNKYSVYFDFEKGDFVRNGSGIMKKSEPYDAWVQWCIKTVHTQRWACMAYSANTGVELIEAAGQETKKGKDAYLEKTITEALLADPYRRTNYVRNFQFGWQGDSVTVTCDIGGVWSNTTPLSIQI